MEDSMKSSITLQRKNYKTRDAFAEKFGVTAKTIGDWVRRGILPKPVRIGRVKYYEVVEVETRLVEFGMN
jgi:hypothetical protein